jgi:hypothetical protein
MPVDTHPAFHFAISSLFMYQSCALVSYFFAGYKMAQANKKSVQGWLLYGGIMSIILLIMSFIDVVFGLRTLDFSETSSKTVYYGGLFASMALSISMFCATGYAWGMAQFKYPDNCAVKAGSPEAIDRDEWQKAAGRWLKYGIGVGGTIGYLVSLGIFFKGSSFQFAQVVTTGQSIPNGASSSGASSSDDQLILSNLWSGSFMYKSA